MTNAGPVGIGVIGAGVIAEEYLRNLTTFPDVVVEAIGDLAPAAAAQRGQQFSIPHGPVETVLQHPKVEIVVNLTTPQAHAAVALQAIAAGKHVYNEKPLSLDLVSAQQILTAAAAAGLRVGCAPDTFLGSGIQNSLRELAAGAIGEPLTALTLLQSSGPESWHPNPAFLFQQGAGPLFDIGPYQYTTLVQIFGAASAVAAAASTAQAQRTIGSGPKAGEKFDVTVPSHHGVLTRFKSGASAMSIFSFESPLERAGWVEITGTAGVLRLPDPNHFTGPLRIRTKNDSDWRELTASQPSPSRGLGVLDLARAIRTEVPHRVSGELAYHVLEIMASATSAAESGEVVKLASTAERTPLLPADWDPLARTL